MKMNVYKSVDIILGLHVLHKLNDATIEIREMISNFLPHIIGCVITYPSWD